MRTFINNISSNLVILMLINSHFLLSQMIEFKPDHKSWIETNKRYIKTEINGNLAEIDWAIEYIDIQIQKNETGWEYTSGIFEEERYINGRKFDNPAEKLLPFTKTSIFIDKKGNYIDSKFNDNIISEAEKIFSPELMVKFKEMFSPSEISKTNRSQWNIFHSSFFNSNFELNQKKWAEIFIDKNSSGLVQFKKDNPTRSCTYLLNKNSERSTFVTIETNDISLCEKFNLFSIESILDQKLSDFLNWTLVELPSIKTFRIITFDIKNGMILKKESVHQNLFFEGDSTKAITEYEWSTVVRN